MSRGWWFITLRTAVKGISPFAVVSMHCPFDTLMIRGHVEVVPICIILESVGWMGYVYMVGGLGFHPKIFRIRAPL